MIPFKFEHGQVLQDSITDFKGTVTGRADYITGCNQYCLTPSIKEDGSYPDQRWMDENRLEWGGHTNCLPVEEIEKELVTTVAAEGLVATVSRAENKVVVAIGGLQFHPTKGGW